MNNNINKNKEMIIRECSERSVNVDLTPFYYEIHLNTNCNQRCIMCKPEGKQPEDVLPFHTFAAFFEQMKPFAKHITLNGGEPLLYPWINEIIDILFLHRIAVTIITNATMLNESLSQKFLQLNELNLRCSIDAATPSTYLKIRGTDDFERVKSNLERFSSMIKNKPNIKQILVYVVMRENLYEVLPFIDYAKSLSPYRIEFHPVRHVTTWHVTNNSGWTFVGNEQSCESFPDEYESIMRQATEKCRKEGISCEFLCI